MESRLQGIQLIKTGSPDDAEKEMYLVGSDGSGHLVGLEFESVET